MSMVIFHRKIDQECEKRYIESFRFYNFWFRIEKLWRKSKFPENVRLKKALLGYCVSYLLLMLTVIFIITIQQMKS